MYHSSSRWLAAGALVLSVTLAACGSSGGSSATVGTTTPTSATVVATTGPIASNQAVAAGDRCPTAATVGSALGITLPKPTTVPRGSTQLPAGATGVACEYAGKAMNVIIELITGIDPSYISKFSDQFPVPYTSVSGVGDQARSFSQTLGAGKDNEGLVATKGKNLVAITATYTPASLTQIEALVNQLL
jgi:hypothetical protein